MGLLVVVALLGGLSPLKQAGDLFMACSDYPYSEGTADPIAGYTGARCGPANDAGVFHDNVALLLDRR